MGSSIVPGPASRETFCPIFGFEGGRYPPWERRPPSAGLHFSPAPRPPKPIGRSNRFGPAPLIPFEAVPSNSDPVFGPWPAHPAARAPPAPCPQLKPPATVRIFNLGHKCPWARRVRARAPGDGPFAENAGWPSVFEIRGKHRGVARPKAMSPGRKIPVHAQGRQVLRRTLIGLRSFPRQPRGRGENTKHCAIRPGAVHGPKCPFAHQGAIEPR